jgi:magnesium chelatase family protein
MGRISGPLLDRIDLHSEVPAVPSQELSAQADGTPSAATREQVGRARAVRRERFGADGAEPSPGQSSSDAGAAARPPVR